MCSTLHLKGLSGETEVSSGFGEVATFGTKKVQLHSKKLGHSPPAQKALAASLAGGQRMSFSLGCLPPPQATT